MASGRERPVLRVKPLVAHHAPVNGPYIQKEIKKKKRIKGQDDDQNTLHAFLKEFTKVLNHKLF